MAFWKPGSERPASALDRDSGSDAWATYAPAAERTRLPVYAHRTSILYMVERYPVVVVVGQTGDRKSVV